MFYQKMYRIIQNSRTNPLQYPIGDIRDRYLKVSKS